MVLYFSKDAIEPDILHLQALLNGESIFAILGNPMVQLNLRLLYNIGSHAKVELPATKVVTHSEVGLLHWQSPKGEIASHKGGHPLRGGTTISAVTQR